MEKEKFITRYTGQSMPIPPVPEHMQMFEAGNVSFGVEFRVLNQEVIAALRRPSKPGQTAPVAAPNDAGVSIHVYLKADDGNLERLRFDCFDAEPHYHYVDWPKKHNDVAFIDMTIAGDPLRWALDCIRARLPLMFERAGIEDADKRIDQAKVEKVLPLVTACAYSARYGSDKDSIHKGAVADGLRRAG